MNEQKDALAADITILKSQTSDIIVSDSETEQKISDILTSIDEKQQKIDEIDAKITSIKDSYLDLNSYNSFVSSTNTTLGALADTDASLQNSIDSLNNSVTDINGKLDDAIYIISFDAATGTLKTRSANYSGK